jgi:hypothetical protein
MNNESMKEVLNELFSHLEKLETQNEAILQFLKEKKRVTDKQLAPYLEQAGNASDVRWRAARIRMEHLLAPEHPGKEIKLGKQPELHEDSAEARKTESERTEPGQTETGKQRQIEAGARQGQQTRSSEQDKSAVGDAVVTRPTDDKKDKHEEKSEPVLRASEHAVTGREQKSESDDLHHPTEVTAEPARQEGAEPAAQLSAKEKDSGKQAA